MLERYSTTLVALLCIERVYIASRRGDDAKPERAALPTNLTAELGFAKPPMSVRVSDVLVDEEGFVATRTRKGLRLRLDDRWRRDLDRPFGRTTGLEIQQFPLCLDPAVVFGAGLALDGAGSERTLGASHTAKIIIRNVRCHLLRGFVPRVSRVRRAKTSRIAVTSPNTREFQGVFA